MRKRKTTPTKFTESGWIDRYGKFHSVEYARHESWAQKNYKCTLDELERRGWIHVSWDGGSEPELHYYGRKSLREKQLLTLHEWATQWHLVRFYDIFVSDHVKD